MDTQPQCTCLYGGVRADVLIPSLDVLSMKERQTEGHHGYGSTVRTTYITLAWD